MSNNHFTFATHALKANSVNIPDPDNNDEITNITDLLPKLQNVENKRIRNIEFLGQLVKVTETSNGIKVYIGEDKNYPAPSASITSLSGTKVASYYLYKTSTPVWPGSQTADWGKTYSNCSTNLKDNTSTTSSWDKIVISVKGAGNSDNHGSIQGINIPHDESLSITTYRNGVEKTSVISMEQLLGAASAKEYSVDNSIKISWDNMIKLGSDATETGRTPDSVEITNFKITLDPNTMFGIENGGNLYYTIKVDDDVLVSRTKADAIYYGVYSSNISANYTTSGLNPVKRTVSGTEYICDGSSLNLKIDNAVKLTSGGTRKSKKIFDIAVSGGTSKSYDYDNETVLSHTALNSSGDEVSFKNAQTITFNSTGYYGDYTVTPKLYDGNSTSKNITASNSSKSNTLTSATNKAWANPKNSVSDMSESFAHSDNHTNADMKTKRLNPNNPKTTWSWNASTDAPTVPTKNSDGSGKLTGVAGGERTHIRHIYSTETSSTGKFRITFDNASNWTDTENIKVFCAKYDSSVTDYTKLVWLMINCKQGNFKGGIEGICKETVSNTIKEFNCDIPASLGSFAKNQGLFIKIALTGDSSTVYPYTVTFL